MHYTGAVVLQEDEHGIDHSISKKFNKPLNYSTIEKEALTLQKFEVSIRSQPVFLSDLVVWAVKMRVCVCVCQCIQV